MAQFSDEEIKNDIWTTLKMWDRFETLETEQQHNLVEYLFKSYAHLYREDNVKIEKQH
jgi:hypothetical protein